MSSEDVEFDHKDLPLRADVNMLGALLGQVLEEQGGEALFATVEAARTTARQRHSSDSDVADESARTGARTNTDADTSATTGASTNTGTNAATATATATDETLFTMLSGLEPDRGAEVVRAFSAYFSLVNMAERVHRIRRRRDYLAGDVAQPGSLLDVLQTLKRAGVGADGLRKALARLRITPVFTAHPTEATRRTLLVKEQRVARALFDRMVKDMLPQEEAVNREQMQSEITLAWQTEEHLSERPTVADEVEHVAFYLSDVLYRIVPTFYESLTDSVTAVYGEEAARDLPKNIVRFGSWVGGDMDGNPNVGAHTIRATLERHRELILKRYTEEVRQLFGSLSQSTSHVSVDDTVHERIACYRELLPEVHAAIPKRYGDMPYRILLWLISARLRATARDAQGAYEGPDAFRADLQIMADSLRRNRGQRAGLVRVRRLLQRAHTFGFHLATLDVRQDALVHRRAAGQLMGRDDFAGLPPTERARLLGAALQREHSPEHPLSVDPNTDLHQVLAVIDSIRQCRQRFGQESVGPYIISMAQGVDDALALLWLARRAGLRDASGQVPLDIAPLFETVTDLDASGDVLRSLLDHAQYRQHLQGRGNAQLIMLGYSDSNRESGLAASRWALQRAQEELVAVSDNGGVHLALFHGRGGTVSRGGSKPRAAILAEPHGAVRGRLRITEQGEIIHAKYGVRDIALRTLELMTGAVVQATATQHPLEIDPSWREVVDCVAGRSRAAYRSLVFEQANFYEYFRLATPIDIIERLCIGSRPVARRSKSGIENLRAIPWVFAWMQSRHMLPGWYGVGQGLREAEERFGLEVLQNMASRWPFFENLLADTEMVLAKADMTIARHYATLAGDMGEVFFSRIESAFEACRNSVCRIWKTDTLLQRETVLQRAIRLRNPYVDAMSAVQVDFLRRWRAGGREDPALERVLLSTVKGIARGLQNTG